MKLKLKSCTLSDIANFRNGKSISPKKYTNSGKFPVYGSNGQIAETNECLNEKHVIVIGRVGAYCGSLHKIDGPSWTTDNSIVVEAKDDVDFNFLYYKLKTLQLQHHAGGSAQGLLTQETLKRIPTNIPNPEKQKRIGTILEILDRKIIILKKNNSVLEKIIQSIFKSWIVDFDRQTEFADSELGKIPKGWKVNNLENLCSIIYRYPGFYGMEKFKEGIPVVRGEHITNDGFLSIDFKNYWHVTEEFSKKFPKTILELNDVIITVRGNVGKVGLVGLKHIGAQISPNCIRLKADKNQIKPLLFYYSLKQKSFTEVLQGSVSTSAVPGITAGMIKSMEILIPSQEIQDKFEHSASEIINLIDKNRINIIKLNKILDSLLPKLMKAEIQV